MTSLCQSSLPSARSKQSNERFLATARPPCAPLGGHIVFSLACVRNTLSPHMIGVELPSSGKGVFQRTFSFVLQVNGNPFSAEFPCPSIPRQAGQLSASPA